MTPQTPAEKVAALEARVNFLEAFLPQISAHMIKSNTFMDKHQEREDVLEEAQEQRHAQNLERIDSQRFLLKVVIALLGLLISIIALKPIIGPLLKTSVNYLPDFFSHYQPIERASMTQNARY